MLIYLKLYLLLIQFAQQSMMFSIMGVFQYSIKYLVQEGPNFHLCISANYVIPTEEHFDRNQVPHLKCLSNV